MPQQPALIVITTGDPGGVGPEVCLKYLQRYQAANAAAELPSCVPLLFGDRTAIEKVVAAPGCRMLEPTWRNLPVISWDEFVNRSGPWDGPLFVDQQTLTADQIHCGQVSPDHGRAAYLYIERAIQQALSGRIDGIVTGPIHKKALQAAGVPFPGHTEILTAQTNSPTSVMMLTSPEITCSLVTAHVGLRDVPELLSVERILETIVLSAAALRKIRGREPRITICGLNPHAGEQGLFGNREEERFIIPAIQKAQKQGLLISGPFPPDTAFLPARREQTDVFVCMYHDQGLIPLKAIAFDDAVNVTLGLPIVRTSVDHGTAFDIAWQGQAAEQSLIEAIGLACLLIED